MLHNNNNNNKNNNNTNENNSANNDENGKVEKREREPAKRKAKEKLQPVDKVSRKHSPILASSLIATLFTFIVFEKVNNTFGRHESSKNESTVARKRNKGGI